MLGFFPPYFLCELVHPQIKVQYLYLLSGKVISECEGEAMGLGHEDKPRCHLFGLNLGHRTEGFFLYI